MLMLVPRTILLAIPINTPFPVTLGLGVAAVAAFGAALAIAAARARPRARVYIFLAGGVACGLLLAASSAYYVLIGPSAAEPIVHIAPGLGATRMRNPYFDLYRDVWVANVVISLLLLVLVPTMGIRLLRRGKATEAT
jgi:ABC-type methionine transport system permease subunit